MNVSERTQNMVALAILTVAATTVIVLVVMLLSDKANRGRQEVSIMPGNTPTTAKVSLDGSDSAASQPDAGYADSHFSGDRSIEEYRHAAEDGDADAMLALASRYADGTGVSRNSGEAIRWYRRAAEVRGQRTHGMFRLGDMYARGTAVPRDEEEAILWFRRSAENGRTVVLADMALLVADIAREKEAKCGEQDPGDTLLFYLSFANDLGASGAHTRLGEFYASEAGAARDYVKAAQWYREGAILGNRQAMFGLAELYARGFGVPRSDAEAVRWYRNAALLGSIEAMHSLGECYSKGIGVAKNDVEAYVWFSLAASLGIPPSVVSMDGKDYSIDPHNVLGAAARRDEIAALLSPEVLAAAQAKAQSLFAEIQAGL